MHRGIHSARNNHPGHGGAAADIKLYGFLSPLPLPLRAALSYLSGGGREKEERRWYVHMQIEVRRRHIRSISYYGCSLL